MLATRSLLFNTLFYLNEVDGINPGTLSSNPGFQFGTNYSLTADPVTNGSFQAPSVNGEMDAGLTAAKIATACGKRSGLKSLRIAVGEGTL